MELTPARYSSHPHDIHRFENDTVDVGHTIPKRVVHVSSPCMGTDGSIIILLLFIFIFIINII